MSRMLAILAAMFAILAFQPAAAAPPAPAVNKDSAGLAVRGYDPVAFFTEGRLMRGSAEHEFDWDGAKWLFASAASRAAFVRDPERYAPQFGGYCAWAVSQHYLAPGDPKFWKIVDGRLYLNANGRAKELWEADQVDAIRRGNANWPAVLTVNQASGDARQWT